MNKKVVLRKVFVMVLFLWLLYLTVKCFLGIADDYERTFTIICYIIFILQYTFRVFISYKKYNEYMNKLKDMQHIKKKMFLAFYEGNKEKADEYSIEVKKIGCSIIEEAMEDIQRGLIIGEHLVGTLEIIQEALQII